MSVILNMETDTVR